VIRLLSFSDGKEVSTLKGHSGGVSGLDFLPDGRHLASASADGTARIWNLQGEAADPILLNGHAGPVLSVAVSPDGRTIATGGEDKTVRLWHAADGKAIRIIAGHDGPVPSLAFHPTADILLTGSADKSVRLFEASTGRLLERFSPQAAAVNAVQFSPTGSHFLSAGAEGGMQIRETASRLPVLAFGHKATNNQPMQAILGAAFSSPTAGSPRRLRIGRSRLGSSMENGRNPPTLGPHTFRF